MIISKQQLQRSYRALPVKADTAPMQIFQLGTAALSTLGKDAHGNMNGVFFFMDELILLLEFFGASWSDPQIIRASQLAYDEYYWLTLAEMKQFFTRVEKGDYESNKNLTPPVFMGFLTKYAEEMKAERYAYYSVEAAKPKALPIAKVDPVTGKDEEVNPLTDEQMQILKAAVGIIAETMAIPTATDEELEEEYRRARNENYRKTIQKRIAVGEKKAEFNEDKSQ